VNKDEDSFEMAQREASRLKSLNSRHIVKYYDSFLHNDTFGDVFIIIMEYCKGMFFLLIALAGDLNGYIGSHGGKRENLAQYLSIFKSILMGI